ncbi:hypothetical protein PHYC_02529 [Phycisphaerales bacterium]|nr:hypothetical protein PHYC_02529 [Phycisphaerales bacterium]
MKAASVMSLGLQSLPALVALTAGLSVTGAVVSQFEAAGWGWPGAQNFQWVGTWNVVNHGWIAVGAGGVWGDSPWFRTRTPTDCDCTSVVKESQPRSPRALADRSETARCDTAAETRRFSFLGSCAPAWLACAMPPPALVNAAVAARLAEAREHLRVEAEWVEPPDPRCHGRQFGFWRVQAGPKDVPWFRPDPNAHRAVPTDRPGPCIAEGRDLSQVTSLALDGATRL